MSKDKDHFIDKYLIIIIALALIIINIVLYLVYSIHTQNQTKQTMLNDGEITIEQLNEYSKKE